MFSATSAMSCYDSIQSVGDSSTDDSGQSSLNSFPSDSGENQTQGCDEDEDDIEEIVVYGYYTPSSGGLLPGLIWALSLPAIGGIITADQPETENTFGCANSSAMERRMRAGKAYNVLYRYHFRGVAQLSHSSIRWMANHGTGTLWTTEWPDGSSSTMEVTGPGTTVVFLAETSCG